MNHISASEARLLCMEMEKQVRNTSYCTTERRITYISGQCDAIGEMSSHLVGLQLEGGAMVSLRLVPLLKATEDIADPLVENLTLLRQSWQR